MKSKLLLEMQRIAGIRSMKTDVPMPCYLFVQKFGRSIQNEFGEIARILGKEEYFFFKTEGSQREETILRRFRLEEERKAGLGKKYNGCILVELSGEEAEKELHHFFEYLEGQKERMQCLFTTGNAEEADSIKKQLERFFFVRVVEGEAYKAEELVQLFEETLKSYSFELTEEAKQEMLTFLTQKKWKESDVVEKRICNLVNDIVYSRMLEEEETDTVIHKAAVIKALENVEGSLKRGNTIGFVS